MKVIVVGAGIMGLSTAWALRKRGHTAEVYEQGPIPNPLGSSVDQHRAIRQPYGGEAGYADLVTDAFDAWDELWRDLGQTLYAETGVLAIDTGADSWARLSAETLDRVGIPYTRLSAAEVTARWPMLEGDGIACGIYLERGGPLFAGRIVEAVAHHVARDGVKLHPRTAVRAVDPERAEITLGDGATRGADVVVVAAGPWVGRLLPDLTQRVTPSRQLVAYITPPGDMADRWAKAPMLIEMTHEAQGFYLIPPVAGTRMKVGEHNPSLEGDPDESRDADEADARRVLDACRSRFRNFADYGVDHARTCFYTAEPEERFIVEPVGRAGWVMTGFSGHGFKFGALMGRALAETLDGARTAEAMTAMAAGTRRIAQ